MLLLRSIPYGRCSSVVPSPFLPTAAAAFLPFPSSSSSDATTNNISNSRGSRWRRSRRRMLSPLNASVDRGKEKEKEEEEEERETGFEIDRQKAREALRKLDQQLQSLSQPEALPKKRPPPALPELNLDRDMITGRGIEEMPEISGSYIAYTAVALVILTIFNNIMFNLFIKPTVDGNEQVTKIERIPLSEPK